MYLFDNHGDFKAHKHNLLGTILFLHEPLPFTVSTASTFHFRVGILQQTLQNDGRFPRRGATAHRFHTVGIKVRFLSDNVFKMLGLLLLLPASTLAALIRRFNRGAGWRVARFHRGMFNVGRLR